MEKAENEDRLSQWGSFCHLETPTCKWGLQRSKVTFCLCQQHPSCQLSLALWLCDPDKEFRIISLTFCLLFSKFELSLNPKPWSIVSQSQPAAQPPCHCRLSVPWLLLILCLLLPLSSFFPLSPSFFPLFHIRFPSLQNAAATLALLY